MFHRTATSVVPARFRGFTLIELLVVIAIIAILAAILFPVFAQAREKARQSSCLSNQKQIGLAILSYAQDADETIPQNEYAYKLGAGGAVTAGVAQDYNNVKWMDAVQPYVKNAAIFNCPSQDFTGSQPYQPVTLRSGTTAPADGAEFGSYGINNAYSTGISGAPGLVHPAQGQPLAAMTSPSTTVLVAEVNKWDASNRNADFQWTDDTQQPDSTKAWATGKDPLVAPNGGAGSTGMIQRHSGVCNVLWGDGHVKASKLTQLCKPQAVSINGGSANVLPSFYVEDYGK
jgi:prepilin-type N-terminal cleavage/methylation domain-containing protein/prepilin-type processing-associated H-X9-DG protein